MYSAAFWCGPLEETGFFALLERENGIRNFAKTRKKLDDPTLPLATIYERINEKLGCQADFHREEAWIFKLYTPNPYLKRATEILHTCELPLCAVAVTSLGSRQTAALLSANGIPADTLLCSSDLGLSKGKLLQKARPWRASMISSRARRIIWTAGSIRTWTGIRPSRKTRKSPFSFASARPNWN